MTPTLDPDPPPNPLQNLPLPLDPHLDPGPPQALALPVETTATPAQTDPVLCKTLFSGMNTISPDECASRGATTSWNAHQHQADSRRNPGATSLPLPRLGMPPP